MVYDENANVFEKGTTTTTYFFFVFAVVDRLMDLLFNNNISL